MTLDEAIIHAKETAKKLRAMTSVTNGKPYDECRECAEEHKQLAEWLEELKERREADRWIPVSERPPKVSGYYLVTRTGNSGKGFVRRSFYDVSLKEWDESRVTAWQPLPEAYKESEDK